MWKFIISLSCLFCLSIFAVAQDSGHSHSHDGHDHSGHSHDGHGHDHSTHDGHGHNHAGHDHSGHNHGGHSHKGHDHGNHSHDGHAHGKHSGHEGGDGHHANGCGHVVDHEFDPGATAFHHISDQNIYSIGPFSFPLPCILYAPSKGWDFFSSGKFKADSHGTGVSAHNQYVLFEGVVRRVTDGSFPTGNVDLGAHSVYRKEIKQEGGEKKDVIFTCYKGKEYQCDNLSTADGGLFGGGITSFYDFSITKNVLSMMFIFLLMSWVFFSMAKAYKTRDGMAPTGLQNFMEPIFIFIQDEVAKPFLGHAWERFLPFLQALFFFILGLNLFGQIPFLGGSNVTGNLAVTAVLAIIVFIVTTVSGNRNYWEHVLWMPGVPAWLKIAILTPVEILGMFIKPLTLMLRLFANITAGHMVLVIFVSLIFVFGGADGSNPAVSYGTAIGSTILTIFMMSIELLVAFIQAFVFTILTASYLGAATEEAHH